LRILFLTQVLPHPLDAGPKVRAYYVLRHLARSGHEITLLSFARDTDSPQSIAHLQTFCRDVITVPMRRSRVRDAHYLLRSLLGSTPFLIARDWVPEMAKAVQSAIRNAKFDAIHADQLWMAPYALNTHSPNPQLILDQHNAVFQIPRRLAANERNPFKRLILAREAHLLARYETRIIQQFHHVVWVTKQDRDAVNSSYQSSAIGHQSANANRPNTQYPISTTQYSLPNTQYPISNPIIPICIDPDVHPPLPRHPNPRRVTFLGGMHWPPNAEGILWFAREVWPLVLKQIPNAQLTIIGKNPPKKLRNIQYPISNTRYSMPNIHTTGYLPDPTPLLAQTAVFIVPLHAGGGMRVKILDAWAWGLPIVSTTIGAEGLQARHEENILLADDAPAFAQAVIDVLRQPALAERLATAGRATVESEYDWQKTYRLWDEVYRG